MGFLTFKYEAASGFLDFLSIDTGMVNNIYSQMRGLGDGTGLMKAICQYADDNDMRLILYVGAEEEVEDGLTDAQLISWYEKFDFKLQLQHPESDLAPQMIRQPKKEREGNWSYPEDSLSKEQQDGTEA